MFGKEHIRIVVEASIVTILITLTVIYHGIVAKMSIVQLTVIGICAVLAFLLLAAAVSWVYSQPQQLLEGAKASFKEFKEEGHHLHAEFKALLTQTLDRQPFVSEDVLAMVEERANNIWVVTTDLKNDVTAGAIRDSVEKNLKQGKNYKYFLPSLANPNFPNAAHHERAYKKWSVYKERSDQVTFIHLPHDTLFLFREVVIYNPIVNPESKAAHETTAKGYTYFDVTSGSRDKLVQIPENYLDFLRGQLHRYSENVGLITELEELLSQLKGRLENDEKAYLANLIGERRIENFGEFRSFIEGVRNRDPWAANLLSKTLSRYTDHAP